MAFRARHTGTARGTHFSPAPQDTFMGGWDPASSPTGHSLGPYLETPSKSPPKPTAPGPATFLMWSRWSGGGVQQVWVLGGAPRSGTRLRTPTYLPLGTGWLPPRRTRSRCRSSPSPGCPSGSAQDRGGAVGATRGPGALGPVGTAGPSRRPHHQLEHVVRHVAPVVTQPAGRGVAEDDGGLGQLQGGLHGGHGHVGQVDHDAQPVHLLHHALGEPGLRAPGRGGHVPALAQRPGVHCSTPEVQAWGRAFGPGPLKARC